MIYVFLTSAKTRAVSVSNDLKNVPGVFQLIRWLNNALLFLKRFYWKISLKGIQNNSWAEIVMQIHCATEVHNLSDCGDVAIQMKEW